MKAIPDWFHKLAEGKKVFGRRKDKLILDIFAMGGMNLLQDQTDLRFDRKHHMSNLQVRLAILAKIKRALITEQKKGLQLLAAQSKGHFSVLELKKKPHGGGVFAAKYIVRK